MSPSLRRVDVLLVSLLLLVTQAIAQQTPFHMEPPCNAVQACGQHPSFVLPPCNPIGFVPSPPLPAPVLYNAACVPLFGSFGGTGQATPGDVCQRNDDDSTVSSSFRGGAFNLFGVFYSDFYINNNGNVTLGQAFSVGGAPVSEGTPVDPAFGFPAMIAPFWADVDTGNVFQLPPPPQPNGVAWMERDQGFLAVTWDHVGYFNERFDKLNTFQVIMTNGANRILPENPMTGMRFNVAFCYNDMEWTTGDGSGGAGGFGGTPALVGVALNGSSNSRFVVGRFDQPGMRAPTSTTPGGVDWLDYKRILLDTSIFPPTMVIEPTPNPSAVLMIGTERDQQPLGLGDRILVAPLFQTVVTMGNTPEFIIPNDPSLMGHSYFAQIGVFDPNLYPNDPLQLSHGLQVVVGSESVAYGDGGSGVTLALSGVPMPGSAIRPYFCVPNQ